MKLVLQRDYRELNRLRNMPRRRPAATSLFGRPFRLVDGPSFYGAYVEIFQSRHYDFRSCRPDPLIIDAGANVGLSVLFFKQLYPKARVLAIEPDPTIFKVLKENVERFELDDVILMNRAAWVHDQELQFHTEGADGGRVVDDAFRDPSINVQAVRLRDYLDERVDFLKVDIEGAETEVLIDCKDRLANVDHLFFEYHSYAERPQSLDVLLGIVRQAGFRVQMESFRDTAQPFKKAVLDFGLDMHANIYATNMRERFYGGYSGAS